MARPIGRRSTHLKTLRDQDKLFGAVASDATAWRVIDRADELHLARLRAVRAAARERAWAAGAGPDLTARLVIDLDATIPVAHSEKEKAAKTWKKTFGFHPLLAYLDRPAAFRYRICAVAGRLTRSGRRAVLHLDRDWPWGPPAGIRVRPAPSRAVARPTKPPAPTTKDLEPRPPTRQAATSAARAPARPRPTPA